MKLDKRQKVILGLVVIAVIILIWQLYALFGGENSSAPAVASEKKTIRTFKETAVPTQVMQASKVLNERVSSESSDQMTENQRKYMALVNEYQIVEMQRLIAQDEAAIAAARAATAESLAKISQSGGSVNNSAFSNVTENTSSGDYELIYTGQDSGEWTATLKRGGQFNDVTAGSVLPNGDKVLSVDENGVLIQAEEGKKLITFNGVLPVNDEALTSPQEKLQSQFQGKKKSAVVAKPSTSSKPPVLPKVVATHVPVETKNDKTVK